MNWLKTAVQDFVCIIGVQAGHGRCGGWVELLFLCPSLYYLHSAKSIIIC